MAFADCCVTGTFVLIILFSAYGIYKDELPFSLNKIFWIFCLFFMGLAPLLQYSTAIRPFYWVTGNAPSSYLYTNLLILCCMSLFRFVYSLSQKRRTNSVRIQYSLVDLKKYKTTGILIFCFALLAQFWLSGNLWYRWATDQPGRISNSSLQLLVDKGLKGLVLYFCLLSLHLFRQKAIGLPSVLLIITAAVLANFPTAVPRYWLAAFYLGLVLTCYLPAFIKRPRKFDLALISGLAIFFPLLTLARLRKEKILAIFSEPRHFFTLFPDSFCGQDFDAYASLRNTLIYVQEHGLLWGKQIMTTLLFFIPRSIWPGKSAGSGSIVNPPQPGSDFNNFSSPLFAEGYLDFGLAGAFLVTALFAWIWCRYDRYFWQHENCSNYLQIMYPAYTGLAFFMLRGDLLSSFAYTCGILVSGYFFHWLLAVKQRPIV